MNNWKPIEGFDNRCDIWCTTFWPDITQQQIIDNRDKIIWDVFLHGGCYPYESKRIDEVKKLLNKKPEVFLDKKEFDYFRNEVIKIPSPSCGMYAIYIAILSKMTISIAGFDHFKSDKIHYFEDEKQVDCKPHRPNEEMKFVRKLLENKVIKEIL